MEICLRQALMAESIVFRSDSKRHGPLDLLDEHPTYRSVILNFIENLRTQRTIDPQPSTHLVMQHNIQ